MDVRIKKGMSLVEMIIAIAIFTIGIEGFSLLFIKTWKQNSFILEKGTASVAASRGVQETVNIIRKARQSDNGAYPIISADNNDLVIYSDIDKDGVTEKIHYYLSEGMLKAGITDPAGIPPSYPSGDQATNTIANYIVNTSTPIFSYYDINNSLLTTPANANEIRMIKINLEVNANPAHFPNNVNFQSFATLRNLR